MTLGIYGICQKSSSRSDDPSSTSSEIEGPRILTINIKMKEI
jgi:hypothetical protein